MTRSDSGLALFAPPAPDAPRAAAAGSPPETETAYRQRETARVLRREAERLEKQAGFLRRQADALCPPEPPQKPAPAPDPCLPSTSRKAEHSR